MGTEVKVGYSEYYSNIDDELQPAVKQGDEPVVPALLIGQKLIEVGAVGFEDVFSPPQADEDGHDAVYGVEGREG